MSAKINIIKLKSLIGRYVKKVEEFGVEPYSTSLSGFFITFDDGLVLGAMDGEYGDNAFEFIDKEKYEKYKKEYGLRKIK